MARRKKSSKGQAPVEGADISALDTEPAPDVAPDVSDDVSDDASDDAPDVAIDDAADDATDDASDVATDDATDDASDDTSLPSLDEPHIVASSRSKDYIRCGLLWGEVPRAVALSRICEGGLEILETDPLIDVLKVAE